jgi:hypothetical protein
MALPLEVKLGNWHTSETTYVCSLFQGNPTFLEAVAAELPTKTAEEIVQHEQWYVEYSALLESKKKAIEAWREERQVGLLVVQLTFKGIWACLAEGLYPVGSG